MNGNNLESKTQEPIDEDGDCTMSQTAAEEEKKEQKDTEDVQMIDAAHKAQAIALPTVAVEAETVDLDMSDVGPEAEWQAQQTVVTVENSADPEPATEPRQEDEDAKMTEGMFFWLA